MNKAMKLNSRNIFGALSLSLIVGAAQMGLVSVASAAPVNAAKEKAVNISHVETYFKALVNKDKQGIAPHFAPNIVLLGPIFTEPTTGREAVAQVLSGFVDTIDTLEVNRTFSSGRDVAVFFSFTLNGVTVKGNEHLHVNENGLIDSIEVAWRPLAASVAVQEIMAKKMGFPAMHLIQDKAAPAAN